ncbi:MAG TPA: LysM domain-containing protein, partial [Rhizomicrobium sp.]|nr:LysM domain-containing protein [Rhizomicrobium sp.]
GPFLNGSATSTSYADFDESYDPINGLDYDSTASSYTVNTGDTLESIAQQLWGDASYWYMIADANGLSSDADLVSGMDLIIPTRSTTTPTARRPMPSMIRTRPPATHPPPSPASTTTAAAASSARSSRWW